MHAPICITLIVAERYIAKTSISQPEHPQRDAVSVANLDVIDGKKTVGFVGYLVECFSFSAYFEQVLVVNEKITPLGVSGLSLYEDLAVEKSFTLVARVNMRTKNMHQIGVA